MQVLPTGPGRGSRLALAGGVLLGLLALVAFASRSGFGHTSNAGPTPAFVNWTFSVFLVLLAAGLPISLFAYVVAARDGLAPARHTSFAARVLQSTVALGAIVAAVWLLQYLHHRHTGVLHISLPSLGASPHGGQTTSARPAPKFEWPVAAVGAAIAVVAFAAWLHARASRLRTPPPRLAADAHLAAALAGTIGDAIDDLEAEPDARRAVIAAYARMEHTLGRSGLQRSPSETALEYLRRVLLGLTARGEAVEKLTTLFQEARFSPHEIDTAMKREAIAALLAIRDGLHGVPA